MTALSPVDILSVLKAASDLTLCALDDVKGELEITGSASDAWLNRAIAASSRMIANHCNREFAIQTYGETFWDRRRWVRRDEREGLTHKPLQLSRWPLANAPSPAGTAPPTAPTLGSTPGGSLSARVYYVKASYVTAAGETAASIEGSIAVPANALLTVAAPGADANKVATGWRVYVGSTSWDETLQAELAIDAAFVEPDTGISAGAALPNYLLVVENYPAAYGRAPLAPTPLAEGLDFVADAKKGQLTRLYFSGQERAWPYFPLTVQYSAGFSPIPDELADAAIRLVAMRYALKGRDPTIRAETVFGVGSQQFVAGDARAAIPTEIADALEFYRMPLIG